MNILCVWVGNIILSTTISVVAFGLVSWKTTAHWSNSSSNYNKNENHIRTSHSHCICCWVLYTFNANQDFIEFLREIRPSLLCIRSFICIAKQCNAMKSQLPEEWQRKILKRLQTSIVQCVVNGHCENLQTWYYQHSLEHSLFPFRCESFRFLCKMLNVSLNSLVCECVWCTLVHASFSGTLVLSLLNRHNEEAQYSVGLKCSCVLNLMRCIIYVHYM